MCKKTITDDGLEKLLRSALCDEAECLEASDRLKKKIDNEIREKAESQNV